MYTFLDDLGSWASARLSGQPHDVPASVGAGAPMPQPAAGD